jgi:hypothetical protein
MKTNKTEFLIKILFLLLLIGCSIASKTSFGLLKKTMKKSNANNNFQNQHKYISQNKVRDDLSSSVQAPAPTKPSTDPVLSNNSSEVPTLPDQPIYAEGWIKYLHYNDSRKKDKMFWKNTFYAEEQRMAKSEDISAPKSDEVI